MHLKEFLLTSRAVAFTFLVVNGLGLVACGSDSSSTPSDPVSQGKAAVKKYACAGCHEPTESGIGTLAGQTTPQPRTEAYPQNLTPDEDTGIGGFTEDQIVKAILTGIDDEEANLCPPMPHFQDEGMTTAEAQAIAAYLKSLPAVTHAIPESTCAEKSGG